MFAYLPYLEFSDPKHTFSFIWPYLSIFVSLQEVDDEDRDSGTESDDENNDYDDSDDPCKYIR